KEKNFIEFKTNKENKLSYRYFKEGLYKKYKLFDEDGQLELIDYMNDARHRYLREEYNSLGLLTRRRQMDLNVNKPRLDQYFADKGICFLSVWVNPKTMKEEKFDHFTKKHQEYNSLNNLRTKSLPSMIKDTIRPEIKPSFKFLLNNIDISNKIVCLTEQQKKDLESEVHLGNKGVVLPHAVESDDNQTEKRKDIKYNSLLAITIARYESQKRLD